MARPLPVQAEAEQHRATAPLLVLVLVLVVATVVVSLCTRLWKQRGSPAPQLQGGGASGKQLIASLSGKAAAVAKMVSWNRRSPPRGDEEEIEEVVAAGEEALWKKTIMMGDKCRPLDFSGHIAYDSDGNQLLPSPPPSPPPAKN